MIPRLRRAMCDPTLVTGALAALAILATVAAAVPVAHGGWLLTWLLLGLTAGYALSGST
jgi:hypothetical protein